MEDSRKGKRSEKKKRLPTPDPHVDGGNGKKAIVYNTKKGKKEGETEKRRRKREREENREKRIVCS